mgnify:FL=1
MLLHTLPPLLWLLFVGCTSLENDMKHASPSVLSPAEMVGFLVTNDAPRCRAFFVERLGFRVVSD